MATVERGCLAIGDITGYTTYLAGVELEHSQDVLADLLGVVVTQMRGLLHLAKLEARVPSEAARRMDVPGE